MAMIFNGRNQIPYPYGCYGYTRGGGKTWHGGQDIVGLDSDEVHALRDGTVIRSRIVFDRTNLTWEWGNYVTIRTECGEQDIYAHLDSRAVVAGQTVRAGDVLGVMGNTGNAAGGYKHVHYERRKADGRTAINPSEISGCANVAGTYGKAIVLPLSADAIKMQIGPASAGDVNTLRAKADELALGFEVNDDGLMVIGPATAGDQLTILTIAENLKLDYDVYDGTVKKVIINTDSLRVRTGPGVDEYLQIDSVKRGESYAVLQVVDGWAYLPDKDGWVSMEYCTAA